MPAGSEPTGPSTVGLPHTWRPFGVRMAGAVFGGALLVVCAFAWFIRLGPFSGLPPNDGLTGW